jgi:UDP-GlcNAc:undecaprenyl-phosphate GlcNAc-1-phosphate transferase
MSHQLSILLVGVASCLAVLVLVPLVRRVAIGYDITDRPAPTKLHTGPTPYLGGVAIAVAAIATSAFLQGWKAEAAVIIIGGLLVGLAGLIDDMRTLSPVIRVAVEIGAGLMAAAAGARVQLFGNALDWVITVVWLVVITNAFNLLDNMDGAAGLIAAVTAVSLATAAGLEGQWLVGGLAAVVGGACTGFLAYNWHPARIFMGDAGSLFIGYLLAVIALKLRFAVPHTESITAVLLFAGPALFVTTLVVLSRISRRHPIYLGGTDHTSHRLLRLGLGPRAVSMVLAAVCVVSCTLGILVGRGVLGAQAVLLPVLVSGGIALLWLLRAEQPVETVEPAIAHVGGDER